MIETLKVLLRRVDFYLRNEPYYPPSDDYKLVPFDEDILDKNPKDDPLRTRAYWAIRRFWINHWLCNPRDVYRTAKFAYQRLTRGWDDRAVWSIDWWLDGMMPGVLRRLKETKHGVPMSMFDGLPMNEQGYHDDPEFKIAEARWEATLDKMIAAFEAHRRMSEGIYEEELGEYPLSRPEGVSKEDWKAVKDDHFKASLLLQERDQKIFEEGMKIFIEHYSSLWD
jgi:hypothetical protein